MSTSLLCSMTEMLQLRLYDVPWLAHPLALDCCHKLTRFVTTKYELEKLYMVENCTALVEFEARNGQLEEFPDLSSNLLLTEIDLTDNKISFLDSNKLPHSGNLRELFLRYNRFASIPDLSQVFPHLFAPDIKVIPFVLEWLKVSNNTLVVN